MAPPHTDARGSFFSGQQPRSEASSRPQSQVSGSSAIRSRRTLAQRAAARNPGALQKVSAGGSRRHAADSKSRTTHRTEPQGSSTSPTPNITGPGPDAEANADLSPEVIMAIDRKENSTMGCAYFDGETGALQLCTDVPLANVHIAEQLLVQIQPTTVLVSARAPEDLLTLLEEQSQTSDDSGVATSKPILRTLASAEFLLEVAHDRLVGLPAINSCDVQTIIASANEVPFENEGEQATEARHLQLIRCGSLVDIDSQVSVGCAGALINELNRRRSAEYLPNGDDAERLFKVKRLSMFSLSQSMFVTQETIYSLQIMQSEQHPNGQISGGVPSADGAKESLSVYGLFHHLAGTPQGKASLRQLFYRPSMDLSIIMERQNFISLFRRPEYSEQFQMVAKVMRRISNVRRNIAQLQKGAESPSTKQSENRGAWAMLKRFVTHVLQLREIIATMDGYCEVDLLRQLVDRLDQSSLILIGDMIEKTIDFEDSKERSRSCVKAGVDRQLDQLKRKYDGMPSLLNQVVDHLLTKIPSWASQYIQSCIFLPQLGFLTVVQQDPATGNGKFEGEGSTLEQWEKIFASDGVVCYKNEHMRELDDIHGDMYCEIGDREVEILHHLTKEVLKHQDSLTAISDLCGHIDALLALAIGAERYQWNRPQVVSNPGVLEIDGGRHPLQELVVPCFVPNDYHVDVTHDDGQHGSYGTSRRTLVLTGPNHSGKSVYLKQVAIIVYLAHIGCYVPADKATVGLVDKLLTRISTRESVSRVESAFAIDLKQVAQAMREATSHSLVVVDEFGKGTSSDDGAGLLAAFLDFLLEQQNESPRLIIATHFHEVFEGAYFKDSSRLLLAHLQVEVNEDSPDEADQLTYLYTLVPGHSSSSFGARCAALNGVPNAIVQRAEVISSMIARNEDLVAACAKLSTKEEATLGRAETVARRFLEVDLDKVGGDMTRAKTVSEQSPFQHLLANILET